MQPNYRVAPCMPCQAAPAKCFRNAVEALLYAREAADGYRTVYVVYRVLAGAVLRLWAYYPADQRA